MNSSLIGKIDKARRYAEEGRQRIRFEEFNIFFAGDNSEHTVRLRHGLFSCDCNFFPGWGTCSHTMALERVLEGMIPEAPVATVET